MAQPGVFDFRDDHEERQMLQSAYEVVTRTNMWDYLATFTPPPGKGFMWTDDARIRKLQAEIDEAYPQHSGFSMSWTMRVMEYIAKDGWDAFVECSRNAQK